MIQNKLYSALSPLVSGRCFYEVVPETNTEYPAIVYQFPLISPNSALEDGDLDDFQVQIDIYSRNSDDIFNLRKPVFEALEEKFEFAERINDHSDYEPDTKLHRRLILYTIAYEG
ncbi:DUF3168 domain-containing protein [Testudinibacter sp. TR-2022]|uniref:DUF3168 domain-containing protein n=1 Tax=Testudinibacter sp. TR-2022 TaxID=2585029 RepID=UPI0011182341|nr:DUF3168 domain-containing protein [Testudinibacter sp. TR-2022]TNH06631.1 DUF3168 domain-containing protein [Pasteurellaceae bacterium Phil11]TNH25532.1 DUF3168 domain-containing protein [Testudinibacter sp. TR-2022]TNH25690.1 DUF3168 domain-containing protein [Testudinibacter sp. TR-2022]